MRKIKRFKYSDRDKLRNRLLAISENNKTFCLLDSNSYTEDRYSKYGLMAGIGEVFAVEPSENHFDTLKNEWENQKDWMFGHLSYDLKNEVENLSSTHPDNIGFSLMRFFCPAFVVIFTGHEIEIHAHQSIEDKETQELADFLLKSPDKIESAKPFQNKIKIKARVEKDEYITAIKNIKEHIQNGDIYEMNYCVEFYGENASLNPQKAYNLLNEISPNPSSCFYRNNERYLMCASPERYLCKRGDKLVSQPIKGTITRGIDGPSDVLHMKALSNSQKDKSENVMIVDLVRNDLSRTASKGSVEVEELFGIYAFPHVFQMISTVTSKLDPSHHFVDAIKYSFPMGSMTGAPKYRAMQIIEDYEITRRGLYSGAVGYIDPDGDFDFNVVIRSLQYNSDTNYLSFMAGGAITQASSPQGEYDECQLKTTAIRELLQ